MNDTNFKINLKILLFFILFKCINLSAISMVYNFRIAQVTKRPLTENSQIKNHTVVGLIFDVFQKKYTQDITQNFAGALGSYIHNFKPYYFRADFAFSHINAKIKNVTSFSGTECDDILFTLGRNYKINDDSFVTLSGLFGIPTHKIVTLEHVGFGYSQVGLGAQFDGSYRFNKNNFIVYGTRYIYFAPRHAYEGENKYKFTIGNIADLLVASNNRWDKHGLEAGYTARFDFGAHIFPNLDDIVKKTNHIRNNFYMVYKYNFDIQDIKNRILFNIAYGFDSKPKIYGNKYIITLWASWNVNF